MIGKQLQGKTAVVTGSASGIGRATALLFAREGAAVSMVDLSEEAGQEVADAICAFGGRATSQRADVTCAADCRRVVERTLREFGSIHVLFNNAGIIKRASVIQTAESDWDAVIAVNAKSVFLMCAAKLSRLWLAQAAVRSSTPLRDGDWREERGPPLIAPQRARSY